MNRHIVVFAKAPQAGRVKTRLCPPLAPAQAAALAEAFLLDVLELCTGLPGYRRTLAYTPRGTRAQMRALAGEGWRLVLQRGRDLGERLARVFSDLLAEAPSRTLIVGADSPHLPPETLQAADAALGEADMVLGPSDDGGFYLIGLSRWRPGLLDEIRWSTEHALADALRRARKLGLTWQLLERDYDVDEVTSLVRLAGDLAKLPSRRLAHTRRALAAIDFAEPAHERQNTTGTSTSGHDSRS